MYKNPFLVSTLCLIFYGVIANIFLLDGFSIGKILIALLLLISVVITISVFYKEYYKLKKSIPNYTYVLICIIILINAINIFRSIFTSDTGESIFTIFGNPFSIPALFTPLAICYGIQLKNIRLLLPVLIWSAYIGVLLLIIGNALNFRLESDLFMLVPITLLYTSQFLVPFSSYVKKYQRLAIYLICLLDLAYIGIFLGSRATILRISFLFLIVFFIGTFRRYGLFLARSVVITMLVFLSVTFSWSITTGESPFEYALNSIQDSEGGDNNVSSKVDTRTFLYTELYSDLVNTSTLMFGKGASGRYFSNYFDDIKGIEAPSRLTVEVGILGILLKTGLVAAVLNLIIFTSAAFMALWRSNNSLVLLAGVILSIHIFILFSENIYSYDLYNYLIWFFVGMCLSKEIRNLSNRQIITIITSDKYT